MLIPNGVNEWNRERYELTGYINDINTANTQVLMEFGFGGTIGNVYDYGVQRNSFTNAGKTSYYTYDGRGSVSDVLNSNGDVQLTYAYTEFGKTTTFFSEYVDNPYRYNAECVDYVPGIPDFQYLRARYYAPHEGRFIQQDTLFGDVMIPLSQNLYAYAMNNPLSFIDPSGRSSVLNLQAQLNRAKSAGVTGSTLLGIQEALDRAHLKKKEKIVEQLNAAKVSGAGLSVIIALEEEVKKPYPENQAGMYITYSEKQLQSNVNEAAQIYEDLVNLMYDKKHAGSASADVYNNRIETLQKRYNDLMYGLSLSYNNGMTKEQLNGLIIPNVYNPQLKKDFQLALEAGGVVLFIGEPLDLINSGLYAVDGQWADVALSFGSVVPIVGDVVGKGGKLIKAGIKYGDEIVDGAKAIAKNADEVIDGAKGVGKSGAEVANLSSNNLQHIKKHTFDSIAEQAKYLTNEQLASKLNKTSFFNKNWSQSEVAQYTQEAYNVLKNQGKTGLNSVNINGEIINVFIKSDGTFDTTYGIYKYSVEEFR